jgi:hypothetical protein
MECDARTTGCQSFCYTTLIQIAYALDTCSDRLAIALVDRSTSPRPFETIFNPHPANHSSRELLHEPRSWS